MNNRRLYVGRLLDADNELDAIQRRQSLYAVKDEPLSLPPLPCDWRLIVAMTCGVVAGMGFTAALIIAIVTSR